MECHEIKDQRMWKLLKNQYGNISSVDGEMKGKGQKSEYNTLPFLWAEHQIHTVPY